MSHKVLIRLVTLVVALGLGACGDDGPAVKPTATPGPASQPPAPPAPGPVPTQPFVTAIAPNVGSVDGEGWARVTGTGFQSGAQFSVDGRPVSSQIIDSTSAIFWPVAHPPGQVDVVMTNPGGLAARLTAAYTYAPRASFDFNGDWIAHAGDDYATDMQLTIRENLQVSVTCGASRAVTFSLPLPIQDGRFSYSGDEGAVSGKLLSPATASGTIDVPDCRGAHWWADKRQP